MGKIILLNTPIGNLGDLTPRVLEALKQGHLFAVEDTRVFKDLLHHLGIDVQGKRVLAFHEHTDPRQLERLLELVAQEDLYICSDAGSPIISDPAYPLVAGAFEKGIKVESFSGVSSPIMALELSGLPPIPFHFHGFFPREKGKKSDILKTLSQGTHIFFEAPTRVEDTLELISQEQPDLLLAVVRELSKKFEQVVRFRARDWGQIKDQVVLKGEFVVLIHQPLEQRQDMGDLKALAQEMLAHGGSPKLLAKLLGLILDRPTKDIYSHLNRKVED